MSKSFRELVEAINKRAETSSHSEKEFSFDDKAHGPKPAGEVEFAATQGYPVKVGSENDKVYVYPKTDDLLNARKMKQANHSNTTNGERSVVSQGSSKMNDASGFKDKQMPANYGDKRQGDMKPVRGPSSVETYKEENQTFAELFNRTQSEVNEEQIVEDVASMLMKISHTGKPGEVTFDDGDTTTVNVTTAKRMMETYSKLNSQNAEKFRSTINGSATGFLKMMKFSGDK